MISVTTDLKPWVPDGLLLIRSVFQWRRSA